MINGQLRLLDCAAGRAQAPQGRRRGPRGRGRGAAAAATATPRPPPPSPPSARHPGCCDGAAGAATRSAARTGKRERLVAGRLQTRAQAVARARVPEPDLGALDEPALLQRRQARHRSFGALGRAFRGAGDRPEGVPLLSAAVPNSGGRRTVGTRHEGAVAARALAGGSSPSTRTRGPRTRRARQRTRRASCSLLVGVLVRGLVAPGDELGEPIDELAALVGQARRQLVVLGRIGRDVEEAAARRAARVGLERRARVVEGPDRSGPVADRTPSTTVVFVTSLKSPAMSAIEESGTSERGGASAAAEAGAAKSGHTSTASTSGSPSTGSAGSPTPASLRKVAYQSHTWIGAAISEGAAAGRKPPATNAAARMPPSKSVPLPPRYG